MAAKSVVMIIDGMGDLPVPELHGKTPLEAAFTPNLDRLASSGFYGQLDPIAPGVTPNTDSGTGMMMGMEPADADLLKRGPVEAAGAGCDLRFGDVAMRANFASVHEQDGQLLVTDRRAGRIERDVPELVRLLSEISAGEDVELQLRATDQHRAVLVVSGDGLDGRISDTDPGDEILPAPLLRSRALEPKARFTADIINEFLDSTYELLRDHPLNHQRINRGRLPANALITRGAGISVPIRNRVATTGMSAAVISGCNTVRGLGRIFGFDIILNSGFTAKIDTDLEGKVYSAIKALEKHDIVFVHVKAPDLCAHDQDPLAKMDVLERFDAALGPLLDQKIVIACAADHSTDSNTGKHTADPVPSLIYSPSRELGLKNGVKFGESACRNGTMDRQASSAFLLRILEEMRSN